MIASEQESSTDKEFDHSPPPLPHRPLFRLFNYYLKEHDAQRAMSFLSDLADITDDVITPERVMEFYRGRAPEDVFGVHSKHDKGRLAATGFYKRSGMASLPQVLAGSGGSQRVFVSFAIVPHRIDC